MNIRIRWAVLVLLYVAVSFSCSAQEKPSPATQRASRQSDELALPGAPAAQPETVRQRLAKAIDVTKALLPKSVTVDRKSVMPSQTTDRRAGAWEREKTMRVPQHRDVMPYLNSRPWAIGYISNWEIAEYIPLTVPDWPTAADAAALSKLLQDADPAVRGLAAEALSILQRPEDIPAIAELLGDDHDALPALTPNWSMNAMGFDRLGGGVSFDKPVKPEDAPSVKFSWHDRKVKQYAATALFIMTGQRDLTPDSFAAWWPDHKDTRNCAWYWINRLYRTSYQSTLHARRMERTRIKLGWDIDPVRKAQAEAVNAVLADLGTCPKETQAKVRLMCNSDGGVVRIDLTPLADLISRERAFELLERKNLWPDLTWQFRKKDFGSYQLVVDGVASQATRLFRPEDAARLLAIRDRNLAEKLYIGRESLLIAASRLMPPAAAGKLDDPATRDGLLRSVLAAEQKRDEYSLRAAAAGELMNVALSANWEFLKAQFFRRTVVSPGSPPEPRFSILCRLEQTPLTAPKRAALIELLSDDRCDAFITDPQAAFTVYSLLLPAVKSVNAYAGKTLIPDSLVLRLGHPETSEEALVEFHKAIDKLKALPPPPQASNH